MSSRSRSIKIATIRSGLPFFPSCTSIRVYKKDQRVRFEIELKHRQTKLVQDYLFNNQLDIFEQQLVIQYFKYSGRVLRLNYVYTDWIVDFERRQQRNPTSRSLVTSYLETEMGNQEEDELPFIKF